MFKEEIYISKDYKLEDYLRLKLRIDSDEDIWKSAINIFVSRINGRYFDAIDKLIEEKEKYGFSIMVLECLIIDTFVKFRYGPNKTETGRYLTNVVIDENQKSFYKLRYYQENKVRFRKFLEEFLILENNEYKKYISQKFYEDIRSSNELKYKTNRELRKNFMLAMNYLCGVNGNFEIK